MHNVAISNILDVTLRDGGYLNEWNFSRQQILSHIKFVRELEVKKIEIGFLRSPENTTSLVNGCPIDLLAEVKSLYNDIDFVGMLDPAQSNFEAAIADKLPYLSLIRMPCTADLVERSLSIAKEIRQQDPNVKVSLNVICVSSYSDEELEQLLQKCSSSQDIDILYFADSRGALRPDEIKPLITLAKHYWDRKLGFHAHNTLGNAISNSDLAFACGCRWIDASLNGFGLAGGNTSLSRYIAHHSLVSPNRKIEQESREFWLNHLDLKHPDEHIYKLYEILAEKNIDPVWTDQLLEIYGDAISDVVASLPRVHYKDVSSVLTNIEKETSPTVSCKQTLET